MKVCTSCGELKAATEFGKRSDRPSGLRSQCNDCRNRAGKQYRTENIVKARAASAKWKSANTEAIHAYKIANMDAIRNSVARWQIANPEACRINQQNRRARKRENGGKLSKDISARLLKLQRGKCACGCNQPLGDNYHLDHIMPLKLGGSNTDDNIQLLRATCNHIKSAKHPIDFMQTKGFLL